MSRSFRIVPVSLLSLLSLVLAAGCTSVQQQEMYAGSLPRPEQIIVFDFAATPQDVELDSGLTSKALRAMKKETVPEEQAKAARKVSHEVAKKLVKEISDMGLPAVLANEPGIEGTSVNMLVRGTFVSIDEGDQDERVAIGLGVGRSSVIIEVELVDWSPAGETVVDRFKVTAKSARNPGAAETMGVGAVAGHLLLSTAITAGSQTASETFGASIEADSSRAASNSAKMMKKFFVRQGWIQD